MPRAINDASLRHLGVLFGGGSVAGLTDGQLLQRFVARDGLRSERAFAVLVERHGPMVLRVARSVLRDHDLADDTFQNAFLALAKRARSLWVRDSIGPWLYAVTVRVATRMRAKQARRRRVDEKAASLAPDSFEPGVPDDLGAALHEEIARLPDRQRQAVVLCLVEGLTHDQAARRLDWPVGTVRSRLARGRDRLKGRLERRGLAPSSALLLGPGPLGRSGVEAVRGALVSATVQSAVSATQGGLIGLVGTVPAGAIAATFTVMKESAMIHRVSAAFGLLAAGVLAVGVSIPAQSKPQPAPVPAPATTQLPDDGEMVTKRYPVKDLVNTTLMRAQLRYEDHPELGKIGRVFLLSDGDFEPLLALLTDSVEPGTWLVDDPKRDQPTPPAEDAKAGGFITINYQQHQLVVRHRPDVHDQFNTRLDQIRAVVKPLVSSEKQDPEATDEEVIVEDVIGLEPNPQEVIEERVIGTPVGQPVVGGIVTRSNPSKTRYTVQTPVRYTVVRPTPATDAATPEANTAEPTPEDVIEERIIGPELTKDEIIEERIIGPEESVSERSTTPYTVTRRVQPEKRAYRVVPGPPSDGPEQESVATEPKAERASDIRGSSTGQDERIDALERKLDAILDELRAIRDGQPEEVSLRTEPF